MTERVGIVVGTKGTTQLLVREGDKEILATRAVDEDAPPLEVGHPCILVGIDKRRRPEARSAHPHATESRPLPELAKEALRRAILAERAAGAHAYEIASRRGLTLAQVHELLVDNKEDQR